MSSWERGYGDFVLRPDLTTLRMVPWHEATALVLCDVEWADGAPVVASPRQILRRQLDRLAERGLVADVGTELEFLLFTDSFDAAWQKGYRDLQPANLYNVDYSMLGTARVEPLLRRIRNGMTGAGMVVESAKGECNLGQHEIAFRYAEALDHLRQPLDLQDRRQGDRRPGRDGAVVHGEVRRAGGQLLPHPHLAARTATATATCSPATGRTASRRCSPTSSPGQQACLRELTYLFAPNVNSYKRFADGQLRPDGRRLGHGQPHLLAAGRRARRRACGSRTGCRAATSTPTWRSPALIAAGLHGIDSELPLAAELTGNAYGVRRPAGAVDAARRGRAVRRRRRWRPRRSARTSSTTTPTPPGWSSPRSTPPSPTGSGGAGSSGCEPPAGRDHRLRRAGRVGRVGARGGAAPPHLPRRGDRGGRAAGAAAAAGGGGRGRRPARRASCSRADPTSTRPATARRPTRAPACPAPSATPPSWPCCARGAGARPPGAGGVPRACRCSTSRSAARCAQHLPDVVGHTGHNPQPGVFGAHRDRARRGLPGRRRARCGHHRPVPPPPGRSPGSPTA